MRVVGQAPGPAADALVGLCLERVGRSRTRGSGADEGVRPTATVVENFRDRMLHPRDLRELSRAVAEMIHIDAQLVEQCQM